ncbi:MAG: N-acetyltransferase [Planctomycetes bacterium]|nr:N-acetyltransferase [Planctomycetota bacterium]
MKRFTLPQAFRGSGASRERQGGTLEIREVASRRDLDQFVRAPWSIYANDPNWVPPLERDVKQFLDRKRHPFYRHGAAAQFLALKNGTPLGRILVSDDPLYNELHGANVGCFGMFECVDDRSTAHGLLETAAGWLRRRGRTSIMGPVDYSTNYASGLLVDGFDTPPRILMNHHPPYYAGLLESWGLAKVKDLYAWWFVDPYDLVAKWRRRADWLARRGGVTIRPFSKKDFALEVERCHEVYNNAQKDHWGFVELTNAEFLYFAKRLAKIGVTEQVLMAEVQDKLVGFSITLPDVHEAIRPLNGRLTTLGLPIGLARLLYRMPRIKTARMAVLVLLESYRRRGIAELLILETLEYGKNTIGYTGAELGWTLEDNELVNRTVARVGGRRYKTYRIYERRID